MRLKPAAEIGHARGPQTVEPGHDRTVVVLDDADRRIFKQRAVAFLARAQRHLGLPGNRDIRHESLQIKEAALRIPDRAHVFFDPRRRAVRSPDLRFEIRHVVAGPEQGEKFLPPAGRDIQPRHRFRRQRRQLRRARVTEKARHRGIGAAKSSRGRVLIHSLDRMFKQRAKLRLALAQLARPRTKHSNHPPCESEQEYHGHSG